MVMVDVYMERDLKENVRLVGNESTLFKMAVAFNARSCSNVLPY